MTRHFDTEIDRLKKKILHLTAMVEDNLQRAVKCVTERDVALADEVIEADNEIDSFEVEVEEECLKILALHQPVANDLRYVVAVLKINNDLERIGDLVVNIAKRAKHLGSNHSLNMPFDLARTLELTVNMVNRSISSLVNNDSQLAHQVCGDDDEIDLLHRDTIKATIKKLREDPMMSDYYISFLNVSRNLERIADHATNIAEDVIYNVEGEIVRHRGFGS